MNSHFIDFKKSSYYIYRTNNSPGGASGKEPACQCKILERNGFDSWDRKISRRKARQLWPAGLSPVVLHRLLSAWAL